MFIHPIVILQNAILKLLNNRRFEESEKLLQVLRGQSGNCKGVLAIALTKIGRNKKILLIQKLALIEEAYNLWSNNKYIANSYVSVLSECKQFEQAFVIYEKNLASDFKNAAALRCYAKALVKSGNYDKATEVLEQSLKIEPDNTIALTKYGKALARKGNYNKASEVFEHLLKIKPNDSIALYYYEKILLKTRQQ